MKIQSPGDASAAFESCAHLNKTDVSIHCYGVFLDVQD